MLMKCKRSSISVWVFCKWTDSHWHITQFWESKMKDYKVIKASDKSWQGLLGQEASLIKWLNKINSTPHRNFQLTWGVCWWTMHRRMQTKAQIRSCRFFYNFCFWKSKLLDCQRAISIYFLFFVINAHTHELIFA